MIKHYQEKGAGWASEKKIISPDDGHKEASMKLLNTALTLIQMLRFS